MCIFLGNGVQGMKLHFNSSKFHCRKTPLFFCHCDNCDHINLCWSLWCVNLSCEHCVSRPLKWPPNHFSLKIKGTGRFSEDAWNCPRSAGHAVKGKKKAGGFFFFLNARNLGKTRLELSRRPNRALEGGSRLEPVMQAEDVRGERNWGRGRGERAAPIKGALSLSDRLMRD